MFKGCRSKNPLRFDFYLPDKNTAIEYDGAQHFRPVRFNGTTWDQAAKKYELQKSNDNIKNRFCKENAIKLIRIPYTQLKNINSILSKELNAN